MTDSAFTHTTPDDARPIDLAPFFERYDRRNRLVFVAALSASLAMSAVIGLAHRANPTALAHPIPPVVLWGLGVVFSPLLIAGWWIFGELVAHGRRKGRPPAGPLPTGADDARNGVRVANAGFAFTLVLVATAVL
jgi:hypothetical protein